MTIKKSNKSVQDKSSKEKKRMPRVCNAVIRQSVTTLKNLKYKIYFDLFDTFLVTTVHDFIVLMSSLLLYNVENSKK